MADSELIQGKFDQYAVWLEGYLDGGGTGVCFPDPQPRIVEGVTVDGGFSEWQKSLLFAVEDFKLHKRGYRESQSILVADGVEYHGDTEGSTLYLFDGFCVQGEPSVPVYPMREVKHLGTYLETDLKRGFTAALGAAATRGGTWSGIVTENAYSHEKQQVISRFRGLASYFDVEITQEEVEQYAQDAEHQRQERIRYLESPEYEESMGRTLEAMLGMEEDV